MPHITISYRRSDSDAVAGRIRDKLANHYGEESVFMDIDSIPFGTDFRDHIQEALAQNDILLAIIGPKWLGHSKGGQLRINEETDPVRIEVETALNKNTPLIPVLVSGAKMPKPSDLPDSLKKLCYRNAAEVDTGRDFHQHMERLIRSMDRILEEKSKHSASAASTVKSEVLPETKSEPRREAKPEVSKVETVPPAEEILSAAVASNVKWLLIGAGAVVFCAALIGLGAWLFTRPAEVTKPQVAQVSPPAAPSSPAPVRQPEPQPVKTLPAAAPASCMPGSPVAFNDDFKSPDPAWDLLNDFVYYADGQMVIRAQENKVMRALYRPLRYKNVTICLTVTSPKQVKAPDGLANGGLIFWAVDYDNYYAASVYSDGSYGVYRLISGSPVIVIPRVHSDSVKAGPGAVNEITITLNDTMGTVAVNGQKLQDFRGQPPTEDSMIGLLAGSGVDERNEWVFQHVVVVDTSLPPQFAASSPPRLQVTAGCKSSSPAAFRDDFKTLDPGWGIRAGLTRAYTADNEMVIKPEADRTRWVIYAPLLFKSATVCVHVESPQQALKPESGSSGGVIFWSVDIKNFYSASVFPDGSYVIYRLINGGWVKVVPRTKFDAVNKGPGAINELSIAFTNNLASLYINNAKARDFIGQPPRVGGAVGLISGSEHESENEWRFRDIAVVESK